MKSNGSQSNQPSQNTDMNIQEETKGNNRSFKDQFENNNGGIQIDKFSDAVPSAQMIPVKAKGSAKKLNLASPLNDVNQDSLQVLPSKKLSAQQL